MWAATGTSGGYADQAFASVDDVTALPDQSSAVDAVALGSAATVARMALTLAHLAAGETVLIRGAAGSIGIAALELARSGGASAVAVTTSSLDRGRRLRELGATYVLDRLGGGDPPAPRTYDIVIDVVGGEAVSAFLERLSPNGRLVLVGAVAGFPLPDFASVLLRDCQQSRSVRHVQFGQHPRRNAQHGSDRSVRGSHARPADPGRPRDVAARARRRCPLIDGRPRRVVLIPGNSAIS